MGEERRSAPRARISCIRVIYESATGGPVVADALDIGRGGLFIRVASPPAVGKRIALEMHVQGEPAPWSALGRVVWTRDAADGAARPPGMGVKLIDVEDSVLTIIDGLVSSAPPLEPSVVVDLVAKNETSATYRDSSPPHPSDLPTEAERSRRGRWLVIFMLLLVAATAVYALLAGYFDRALRSAEPQGPRRPSAQGQPAPAMTAAPTLAPMHAPSTTTLTPTASAVGSARAPAASTPNPAEPRRGPAGSPPLPTWRGVAPSSSGSPVRKAAEDNPY